MVPMRYLVQISKSKSDSTLTDLDNSNAFIRGSRKGDFRLQEFQRLYQDHIKADSTTATIMKRWLVNRLFMMMGFFVSCMLLIVIWVPGILSIGAIGLCLVNMFQAIVGIENDVEILMKAQFQLISMKRLYDYTTLDEEAEYEKES